MELKNQNHYKLKDNIVSAKLQFFHHFNLYLDHHFNLYLDHHFNLYLDEFHCLIIYMALIDCHVFFLHLRFLKVFLYIHLYLFHFTAKENMPYLAYFLNYL